MKFLPLLRLQVMHSYYSNGLCPDFQVEPTIETQTVLKNHRCILKTFPAGIQILITVGEQDSPLIPLDNDTKFIFQLRLQNPDFPLFTDLTQLRLRPYPLFINDPLGSEKLPQLSLQSRQASAREIYVVQEPSSEEKFVLGSQPLKEEGEYDIKVEELGSVSRPTDYDPLTKIMTINTSSVN